MALILRRRCSAAESGRWATTTRCADTNTTRVRHCRLIARSSILLSLLLCPLSCAHPTLRHVSATGEGGTRATAFISGGVVPAHLRGTTSGDKLVHISDWYPTFCVLA